MAWNDDRVAQLKKLWMAGRSASQIAAELKGGLTRSAVIGKVHRLGLSKHGRAACACPAANMRGGKLVSPQVKRPRPQPPRPGPQNRPGAVFGKVSVDNPAETERKRAAAKAESDALLAAMAGPANDDAIPLIDRGRFQCSFPVGTPERPAEQMCCGQRVAFDAGRAVPTYCAGHARIALNARQPVRKIPSEPSQRRAA